ncbi:MAG: hypothetical protein NVS2B17_28800 [Candidatus Velthaea sp.]
MSQLIRMCAAVCVAVAVPVAAFAAKTFEPPTGWNHVVASTPGVSRTQDVWKAGEGQNADVLAVLTDSSVGFIDALGAVRSNVQGGGLKMTIDQDRTCDGKKAHMFELSFGADKKTLINQTIVDEGSGSMRITYTRIDGQPFSPEVKAALAAFCGT